MAQTEANGRQTASDYINNLLLSRGLLRNGTPIEFAYPKKAEGGLDATMSQIMNLVHDMILRRDRESETLNSLSQNMSALRQLSTTQAQQIETLEGEKAKNSRQISLSSAQERSMSAAVKTAEHRNRVLKAEMAKLKATVQQARTQCATDVRRRDLELSRLKKHLEGKRGREQAGGAQLGVVVINPSSNSAKPTSVAGRECASQAQSSGSSLRQGTTEHLTGLCGRLSDDNETLSSLIHGTLATLRTLQGLPTEYVGEASMRRHDSEAREIGFLDGGPSCEDLAAATEDVLEHLRVLLTSPSFVPLEEVAVRDEEIQRLREGWEMMAVRWREAVTLMDGWKRRMVNEGDTINLEDLKHGLQLGSGIPMAQESRPSPTKPTEDVAGEAGVLDASHGDMDGSLFGSPLSSVSATSLQEVRPLDDRNQKILTETDGNARRALPGPRAVISPARKMARSTRDVDRSSPLNRSTSKKPQVSRSRATYQVQPTSPPPTVEEKLQLVKAEANEVRKRDEESRSKDLRGLKTTQRKPRGGRRRSTLSPEELATLVGT